MVSRSGVKARIARELDALRRELAQKNNMTLMDVDRELIIKEINELKGRKKKKIREIIF